MSMSLFDDLPEETSTVASARVSSVKEKKEQLSNDSPASPVSTWKDSVSHKRSLLSVDCDIDSSCSVGCPPLTDCSMSGTKKLKRDDAIQLFSFVHARKGERVEMQDSHVLFDDLSNDLPEAAAASISRLAYYGVFDGHAGARASRCTAQRLHKVILEKFPVGNVEKIEKGMKKTLVESFRAVDEEFLEQASKQKAVASSLHDNYIVPEPDFRFALPRRPVWKDGTTATVVLIVDNTLFVANIGDSKAILCRENKEGISNAVTLTKDHNPTIHEERMRIQKAGGTVRDGRVNGVLEVSRSIGDGHFKKYGVTSVPEVRRCQLTEKDRYLLIACDGLWKSFNNEETLKYVQSVMEDPSIKSTSGKTLNEVRCETVCGRLSAEAVKRLSGDNVTVLFVKLEH